MKDNVRLNLRTHNALVKNSHLLFKRQTVTSIISQNMIKCVSLLGNMKRMKMVYYYQRWKQNKGKIQHCEPQAQSNESCRIKRIKHILRNLKAKRISSIKKQSWVNIQCCLKSIFTKNDIEMCLCTHLFTKGNNISINQC